MEKTFRVVQVGELIEKEVSRQDGSKDLLEIRRVVLTSGGDSLLADLFGRDARNFNHRPGDWVSAVVRLKVDSYKTQDGVERMFNAARIIDINPMQS